MKSDRVYLSVEDAIACLPEKCHTTSNPMVGIIVGADCDKADAEQMIRGALLVEIGGDKCRGSGHGIVAWEGEDEDNCKPRYISHDENKLSEVEKRLMGEIKMNLHSDERENKADRLFTEAFREYRDPRSQAYKDGVLAGIRSGLGITKPKLPFTVGTAEADAWFSGVIEGRRIAKESQQ